MATQLHTPFMIGDVEVRNRLLAAPLSGISDLPFRNRTWAGGAGLVVSEMIASKELCHSSKQSVQRAMHSGSGPKVLQLAGTEAQYMGEAAVIGEAMGAEIIDINMGCPAKKVTGKVSGSALMRDLDHAMTLVEATVGAVNVPVTLKMRLGWDHDSINAPELAKRAVDAGVQMITVHGRTRCQFYEGAADWQAVAAVRAVVDVPLVVNGDIESLDDAERALAYSGADAVMVGRAGCGAPWAVGDIVRQSAGVTVTDVQALDLPNYVFSHVCDMVEHYGERVGLRNARKHLGWYFDKHSSAPVEVKQALLRADSLTNVESLVSEAFAETTARRKAA